MSIFYPQRYAVNTATGIIEPIELEDTATGFTFLDKTSNTLIMPTSGDDVVYSEEAMGGGHILRPGGNMIGWEVSATISLSANFASGGSDRNVTACGEVAFSRLAASSAFVDGISTNPTNDPDGDYLFSGTDHSVILRAWLVARQASDDCQMSVSWFGGGQEYWSLPQWIVADEYSSGTSMTVNLSVSLAIPSFRSGRCGVSRVWESPWYIRALKMGEPEAGLGTAWNVNILEKPIFRNGPDSDSPLFPEADARVTMSGREGGFIFNKMDTSAEDTSADVSYLRNSDVRTVAFTSTGDITYSDSHNLTPSGASPFPLPYNGQNYIIQRLSRKIESGSGDTASGSITNARARVIDPT